MSILSQQVSMQTQRKLMNNLAANHTDGDSSDSGLDIKAENMRLRDEVELLTKQLHDANSDILWRDTLAAHHAEAYARAEAAKLTKQAVTTDPSS